MAPSPPSNSELVTIAAVGDVHCRVERRQEALESLAKLDEEADLLLIAGDLTAHGLVEEGEVLAEACSRVDTPVFAVLGNHDFHEGNEAAIRRVLEDAGVRVLEGDHAIIDVRGFEVGIAGAKGFVGGFPGSHLSDYGEDSLRAVYRETTHEVEALERALAAIAPCRLRLVVTHYSPAAETLAGEPEGIWTFLGTDRLAAPIRQHEPELAVHGHAHAGTFEGRIGEVPVYNVSVPVLGQDRNYHLFGLEPRPGGVH
jgi:uncharacterized protein